MKPLLQRLRSGTYIEGDETAIHEEAADEIERLRRALSLIADAEGDYDGNVDGNGLKEIARDALTVSEVQK